jgi:hypothetical protein
MAQFNLDTYQERCWLAQRMLASKAQRSVYFLTINPQLVGDSEILALDWVTKTQVASETGSLSVNDQSTFKQLRDKYFGQNAFATNFRRSSERLGEVQGLVRGLSNEYILMTYGTALPSYLDALQFYKEDSKPKRQHRALLVGAAGSSSVKEFVWGVNHVFPGASCSIIDIEGAETPAAAQQYGANFIYGDGFQMPFSNAFDTIHVNRLFGYLEEDLPRDPAVNRFSHVDNFSSVRQTFFSSVYDSLIPGGMSIFSTGGTDDHTLYPVYPESRGVTSEWFYQKILKIFSSGILSEMEDPVPKDILEKYNLPNIKTALFWIHTPKTKSDGEVAKKRFAFEEIFYIQIQKQIEKTLWQKQKSFTIKIQKNDVDDFIKDFPFTATNAQLKVIDTIKTDLLKTYPMARLLEGDVGSGKTAVGAVASFMVSKNSPEGKKNERLQTAYMAPTEILSIQLFENFIKFFKEHKLSVGLLTSSGARKFPAKTKSKDGETTWTKISKAQLKKWVLNGEVDILIGTHSLIQKTVQFKNLALVIIDEQHRFGTAQRQKLLSKGGLTPHLLSMTATPIPRTLA